MNTTDLTDRECDLIYEALTTVDIDTLNDNLARAGHDYTDGAEVDALAARTRSHLHAAVLVAANLGTEAWEQAGQHFSCVEINALAAVFSAAGAEEYAVQMVAAHARGDCEEEDLHHDDYLDHQSLCDWSGE